MTLTPVAGQSTDTLVIVRRTRKRHHIVAVGDGWKAEGRPEVYVKLDNGTLYWGHELENQTGDPAY